MNTQERSKAIIDALDMAFGGRSQWGPEELARAVVGQIANNGFPNSEWYIPIHVLKDLEEDMPHSWLDLFSKEFEIKSMRLPQQVRTRKR